MSGIQRRKWANELNKEGEGAPLVVDGAAIDNLRRCAKCGVTYQGFVVRNFDHLT